MPYIVNKYSDGGSHQVDDFLLDDSFTTSSFVGKFTNDYASAIGESFLWQMENFASALPPKNAKRGQLWYYKTAELLHVYDGADGSDSTIFPSPQWAAIGDGLYPAVLAHIADLANPHILTKADVGLGAIPNEPLLDKAMDLGDLLDVAAARTNLDVYDTSLVYNKSTSDIKFLDIYETADNSLLFDGTPAAGWMQIATPLATSGIIGDAITTGNMISGNAGKASMRIGTDDLIISSGVSTIDDTILVDNDSGVIFSLLTDSGIATAEIKLIDQGLVGTSVVSKTMLLDQTNLHIDGNQVYHGGYNPTWDEIGALSATGTAVNSNKLAGAIPDAADGIGTIAVRWFSSLIAKSFYIDNSPNDQTSLVKEMMWKNNTDTALRYGTTADVAAWSGASDIIQDTKHWAAWDSAGNVIASHRCSVSLISPSVFRVIFDPSYLPPSGNYCAIPGIVDDGATGSFLPDGNGQQGTHYWDLGLSTWVGTRTSTYVEVGTKNVETYTTSFPGDDDDSGDGWQNSMYRTTNIAGLYNTIAIYY